PRALVALRCVQRLASPLSRDEKRQTQNVVAAVLASLVALARAAKKVDEDPSAAAMDAKLAGGWASRIGDRMDGVVAVPIRTPLSDVAVHVKQTPGIRLLLRNRMGLQIGVVLKPTHRLHVARMSSRRARAARIL